MKTKDLILIALICVNVTLGAVALTTGLSKSEPQALAGSATRAGDYAMVAGRISPTREVLLVVDTVARQANLYVPKPGVPGTWDLTSARNLAADFRPAAGRGG